MGTAGDAGAAAPDVAGGARPTPGPPARGERAFALCVAVVFAAALSVVVAHHEPWRDELQAWLIARDSASVSELLARKRGEGHPDAWYLLLFGVSRFTGAPGAMQALHLAIASGVAYVVARWAPFPRAWRVLALCGYFLAYEYAAVSRGYALGVLALCAWCALAPRWAERPFATAGALGVLANTSAFGAVLAGAATLTSAVHVAGRPDARRAVRARPWRSALAVLAVLAAAAWAAHSMAAPRAAGQLAAGGLGQMGAVYSKRLATGELHSARRVARVARAAWRAYLPLTAFVPGTYGSGTLARRVGAVLAVPALVGVGWTLRRRPLGLVFFAAATSAMLLFLLLIPVAAPRHAGHLYLALLAGLWVGTAALPRPPGAAPSALSPATRWLLGPIVWAQAAAAVLAIRRDIRRPFSNAEAAARYVTAHDLDRLPIVASERAATSGLAGYVRRPVFNLEEGRLGSYVDWERSAPWRAAPSRLYAVVDSLLAGPAPAAAPGAVVIALTYDLPAPPGHLDVRPLARFTDGIQRRERFRLYLARPRAPGP